MNTIKIRRSKDKDADFHRKCMATGQLFVKKKPLLNIVVPRLLAICQVTPAAQPDLRAQPLDLP
jgi:hypothetical protein